MVSIGIYNYLNVTSKKKMSGWNILAWIGVLFGIEKLSGEYIEIDFENEEKSKK